jgi:hypothetical protein
MPRPGLQDVGPDLNAQFDALYDWLEGKGTLDESAFRSAAFGYFDAHSHPDPYFSNFTQIGLPFITRTLGSLGVWEWALGIAHEWEAATGGRLHKGTGYYFAAVRDFALGDLSRGWLCMHQAVVEDRISSGQDWPDTPAVAFVMLNGAKLDQAYREKVLAFEADLIKRFSAYVIARGSTFTLPEYRDRLARHGDLLDVQVTLAYVVSRLAGLSSQGRSHIIKNQFAALLMSEISFLLCLATDEALHRRVAGPRFFLELASEYASRTSLGFKQHDLQQVNEGFRRDFTGTMRLLLAGSPLPTVGRALSAPQRDIAIAYGMRNKAAHGLERPDVIASDFDAILEAQFFALFRAVDLLYM